MGLDKGRVPFILKIIFQLCHTHIFRFKNVGVSYEFWFFRLICFNIRLNPRKLAFGRRRAERYNDFVLIIVARFLIIMSRLDSDIFQCVGMYRFDLVPAFLGIRNEAKIFILMLLYPAENSCIHHGDNSILGMLGWLSDNKIMRIVLRKSRRFVRFGFTQRFPRQIYIVIHLLLCWLG
ncbi:hypothetical protein D3C77_465690 [compost metagenome]